MTALKPAGLDGFLRKPDSGIGALLIYGEEPEAVREMAARAVKRIAGSLDDPFGVMVLQDSDLASDPARLADEVQSMSMFGGTKAIWIKGAEQAFLKAVQPVLDGKISGNLVVAEAAALAKSSPLRTAFEKSQHALIVPLYEAEVSEIASLAEQILARDGLKISSDAVHRFIELAGTSRSLARREAEKLALYCLGQQRAGVEDVEAVCGNDIGANPDDLADSVFGGEVERTDRIFHALIQSGTDAGQILAVTQNHAMKLQDFRIAMEKGVAADQAMRSAKPPIFFKRQDRIRAQLRSWSLDELTAAGATLGAGVFAVRQNARLGQAIAARALLSVARQGLKLRHDR
jgi:DNA polymerase III subunit delta